MGLVWSEGEVVTDPTRAYGGNVPLVQCYWHVKKHSGSIAEPVLNLSSGVASVYESTAEPDGWKKASPR